jgi:TPR repeat protein
VVPHGLLLAFSVAMRTSRLLSFVASCAAALVVAAAAVPAAHAGPREDYRVAELSIRSGDVVTAMSTLRRLSDEGDGPAQARRADLLFSAENYADAMALYRKASDQGNGHGDWGVGRMHAEGAGVARDPAQALQFYRKSAERNAWQGFDALARAYRTGDLGLTKDPAEAQAMEKRAEAAREAAEKELK